MSRVILEILGHLSFALVAASFLVKDILWLRILAIVANLAGIVYNWAVVPEPLWLVIGWLMVFICINGAQIVLLYRERGGVRFTEEEKELHASVFRSLTPVEMFKLLRVAAWREVPAGATLAEQGVLPEEVTLLFNGRVAIEADGKKVAEMGDGAFVGEMSYFKKGPATATARTLTPCRCVVWKQDALRALLRRNPSMEIAVHSVLSLDLVRKIEDRRS